jgi:hypothetical protein
MLMMMMILNTAAVINNNNSNSFSNYSLSQFQFGGSIAASTAVADDDNDDDVDDDDFDKLGPIVLRIKHFIWLYILPIFCLLGIVSNLLNVAVFSNKRILSMKLYKLMLIHSLLSLIFAFISFFNYSIMKRRRLYVYLTGNHDLYYMKMYELWMMKSFSTILAFISIFVELTISFYLLLIIKNSRQQINRINKYFKLMLIAFVAVSVTSETPYLISSTIEITKSASSSWASSLKLLNQTTNHSLHQHQPPHYHVKLSQYAQLNVLKALNSALSFFQGFLAPLMLLIINLSMITSYRSLISKKLQLTTLITGYCESGANQDIINNNNNNNMNNQSQSSGAGSNQIKQHNHYNYLVKNLTRMIFLIGFLFLLTNSLSSLTRLVLLYFNHIRNFYSICAIITNLVNYSAQTAHALVYYKFNRRYRSILNKLLFKCLRNIRR